MSFGYKGENNNDKKRIKTISARFDTRIALFAKAFIESYDDEKRVPVRRLRQRTKHAHGDVKAKTKQNRRLGTLRSHSS